MPSADRLLATWYARRMTPLAVALSPLAGVFATAVATRRALYDHGMLHVERVRAPVVVVGNLTAGGSGKTPLAIALAEALAARGWHPGFVSRGYGRRSRDARLVRAGDDPEEDRQRPREPRGERRPRLVPRGDHSLPEAHITCPGSGWRT